MLRSLKGDRAFRRLRKGRPGHAKYLSLRYLPTRGGFACVGIVVSKKVGKAVTRNQVRRRLREALYDLLRDEAGRFATLSFDMVVITRPDAAEASYWQLEGALRRALQKSGLFS